MPKIGRLTQWLLSAVFVIVLVFPHIVELWDAGGNTASVEKRAMGKMPEPSLMWHSFSEYAKQFDSFYNDAFGFRNQLIRWNNRLRLLIFNESPVKGVRVGREGWLFYANEWVFEDYENIMPYSNEDLAHIGGILDERLAWLEKRGIALFILVAPNKHTIYSEYLPPGIHKLGEKSRLDQVAAYIAATRPEVEFIDPREALLKAKPIQRLYHRTDSHWNDYGAFISAGVLLKRIGRYFPNVRPLSLENYTVSINEGEGGDLAGMLSLGDLIREERITLTPRFKPRAIDGTRPYPDPVKQLGREMVVKETGDSRLPKALVFRDSYSWALIPFLAESFQSVVFVWTFDFLPQLIEREKPDLIIFESVERYINFLVIQNPEEVKAAVRSYAR
jgi:hypothetical protein